MKLRLWVRVSWKHIQLIKAWYWWATKQYVIVQGVPTSVAGKRRLIAGRQRKFRCIGLPICITVHHTIYIAISTPSEHSWLSFSKVHDWVPSKSVCFDAFEIARKSDFFVLVASHWERSLLYLGGEKRFQVWDLCLIIVEVHPFKPTKDSTFTIWYLESEREFGLREFWKSEGNENTQEGILTSPSQLKNKVFLDVASSTQSLIWLHIPAQSITRAVIHPFWRIFSEDQPCKTQLKMGMPSLCEGTCRALASLGCVWPHHSPVRSHLVAHPDYHCQASASFWLESLSVTLSLSSQQRCKYGRCWEKHSCHWRKFALELSSRLMNSPSVPLVVVFGLIDNFSYFGIWIAIFWDLIHIQQLIQFPVTIGSPHHEALLHVRVCPQLVHQLLQLRWVLNVRGRSLQHLQ